MGFEVTSMHDYVYIISPQRVLARFALSQDYARNICYCCLKKKPYPLYAFRPSWSY